MKNKPSEGQSVTQKHPSYFEGVLQLRNPNQEVLNYINAQFKKEPEVRIAKEIRQPNGVDLWLSSNKFLMKLGRGLNETFQGELKVTSRLFSTNRLTSKNVYRMCVFFRVASFRRNDIVKIKGVDMKVLALGKRIRLQEVQSGKKHEVPFELVERSVNQE